MFRIRKPRPVSAPDLSRLDRMDGVRLTPNRVPARAADDDLLAVARGAGVLRDRRVDATAAALVQYATTDDAAGSMATFRRMGGAA